MSIHWKKPPFILWNKSKQRLDNLAPVPKLYLYPYGLKKWISTALVTFLLSYLFCVLITVYISGAKEKVFLYFIFAIVAVLLYVCLYLLIYKWRSLRVLESLLEAWPKPYHHIDLPDIPQKNGGRLTPRKKWAMNWSTQHSRQSLMTLYAIKEAFSFSLESNATEQLNSKRSAWINWFVYWLFPLWGSYICCFFLVLFKEYFLFSKVGLGFMAVIWFCFAILFAKFQLAKYSVKQETENEEIVYDFPIDFNNKLFWTSFFSYSMGKVIVHKRQGYFNHDISKLMLDINMAATAGLGALIAL